MVCRERSISEARRFGRRQRRRKSVPELCFGRGFRSLRFSAVEADQVWSRSVRSMYRSRSDVACSASFSGGSLLSRLALKSVVPCSVISTATESQRKTSAPARGCWEVMWKSPGHTLAPVGGPSGSGFARVTPASSATSRPMWKGSPTTSAPSPCQQLDLPWTARYAAALHLTRPSADGAQSSTRARKDID